MRRPYIRLAVASVINCLYNLTFKLAFLYKKGYDVFRYALVAQLDRVSPSEGEGREFESRQAHQRA